jgi:hypothetical protein
MLTPSQTLQLLVDTCSSEIGVVESSHEEGLCRWHGVRQAQAHSCHVRLAKLSTLQILLALLAVLKVRQIQ